MSKSYWLIEIEIGMPNGEREEAIQIAQQSFESDTGFPPLAKIHKEIIDSGLPFTVTFKLVSQISKEDHEYFENLRLKSEEELG